MSTADVDTRKGYRSIADVTFDLDGKLSTETGWIVFEVSEGQPECCRGVIGTVNNHVTLRLIRFARTQRPWRIHGLFDDGKQTRTLMLDDVVVTSIFVFDVSAFFGFRASTVAQP